MFEFLRQLQRILLNWWSYCYLFTGLFIKSIFYFFSEVIFFTSFALQPHTSSHTLNILALHVHWQFLTFQCTLSHLLTSFCHSGRKAHPWFIIWLRQNNYFYLHTPDIKHPCCFMKYTSPDSIAPQWCNICVSGVQHPWTNYPRVYTPVTFLWTRAF